MKRLLAVLVIVLCGCGDNTKVLSADGMKMIGKCYKSDWMKCISTSCPDGFIIVEDSIDDAFGLVRCKKGTE